MLAHQVTKDFERALCEYTGAPYAVAVNSCTMALLLAVTWHMRGIGSWLKECEKTIAESLPSDSANFRMNLKVEIPKRTYVSVPMSIVHAGAKPTFRDESWSGAYQLKPLPVWDSARRFTSGMYRSGFVCVSFHTSKILSDTQGGAILHDDPAADIYFRKARFDGRTEGIAPKDDLFDTLGYHCYLSPDVAARLLWKLSVLPKHNKDLPNSDYPDLSLCPLFK